MENAGAALGPAQSERVGAFSTPGEKPAAASVPDISGHAQHGSTFTNDPTTLAPLLGATTGCAQLGAGDDGRLPGFMAMSALAAQSRPYVPPHHTPCGASACDDAHARAASMRPVPLRPEQGVSLPQPTFGAAMPGGSPGYVPYGEAVTRTEFQQVSQQI
eukprot:4752493-Prymnesium_polylepis.1